MNQRATSLGPAGSLFFEMNFLMIYLIYLALYTVDYENLIVLAQLGLLEGVQLAGT